MHFIADTDAEENHIGIQFLIADVDTAVLYSLEGGPA